MYVLSLDASSTQIGFSIFNKENNELIFAGHITMPDDLNLLEKATYFHNYLSFTILENYPLIDEMVIEKSYEAMFGGSSTSKVTTMLNKINFAYQYICYFEKLKVHELSVSDCRTYAYPGIKFGKDKDEQKEKGFYIVKEEIGEKYFGKKVLTRNSKKGKKGDSVFEDWCFDISDSYIVGKAFLNLISLKLTPKDIQDQKDNKKKLKKESKKKKKIS